MSPLAIGRPLAFVRAAAAALLVAIAPVPAAAGGTPWPDAPYSYFANDAKLESVLADFATGFTLSLAVQPDVKGVVNGRFNSKTPTEFLTKLGGIYGFVWYTHAGTLFISRASDVVTRGISAPGSSVATLRKALGDLGVIEPRFGWGELVESGVVLVSGPPSYVQLVEATVRNLPARAQQLRVFKLQHASVQDRTVASRDATITIPGLATILRAMMTGTLSASPSPTPSASPGIAGLQGAGAALRPLAQLGGDPAGAAGAALPAAAAAAAAATTATAAGTTSPGTPRPTIQSEPRLNALIVQDVPERMPLYEQVIALLDVPTQLVEIEAMIVDISSDRAHELGVDWSARVGKVAFNVTGGATALTYTSASTAAANFLITQLRLLESKGDVEILSRPSVLTSDNLAAVLDLSETFFIKSQGERVANVTPVTAGIMLRVTPHVVEQDGKKLVQLKIDIEDGQVSTAATVDALPTVTRSSVSTEATVMNGEALLIAGYSANRNLNSRSQVPVLGDVPGVGSLFSNTTRNTQKRERMFLIRPKVIGLPGQGAEVVTAPQW